MRSVVWKGEPLWLPVAAKTLDRALVEALKPARLRARIPFWAICWLPFVAACDSPAFADIDGSYQWVGTRVAFQSGRFGPSSMVDGTTLHATTARLSTRNGVVFLDLPECSGIPLKRGGERGQVLTAELVSCDLSAAQKALGVRVHGVTSLRIDTEALSMHGRFCESGELFSGCAVDDAVFSPLPASGVEAGGAAGVIGDVTPRVDYEASVAAWEFSKDRSVLWVCDELVADRSKCAAGQQAMDIGIQGILGSVHQMKDGRFYLDGFDCYAPAGYQGEPLECGKSLDGLSRIPAPKPWVTHL